MFHWDRIGNRWEEAKATMRETWADLTDDEIAQMRGEREQVVALLMNKYGWSRTDAEKAADDWAARAHDGLSAG